MSETPRFRVYTEPYEPSTFYDGENTMADEEVCDRLNEYHDAARELEDARAALREIREHSISASPGSGHHCGCYFQLRNIARAFFDARPEVEHE